jgi:hypothetical protein
MKPTPRVDLAAARAQQLRESAERAIDAECAAMIAVPPVALRSRFHSASDRIDVVTSFRIRYENYTFSSREWEMQP